MIEVVVVMNESPSSGPLIETKSGVKAESRLGWVVVA